MNHQKKPSRQDALRKQQQATFVGREEQIATFRYNLSLSPDDWCFLFNVWGQGGVGKSTLLRQFRRIVEESNFVTAFTSDSETTVSEVLGKLVQDLEQQKYKLSRFSECYKIYRQKKQELETDSEAPQGFSAFLGKTLAKAGLGLAKQIPGSGAITPFLDEGVITAQAGEWISYVVRKIGNKDEARLLLEPSEVLTPLFLQELGKVAEQVSLVLFFDTYDRTNVFLDNWLQNLLEGKYGDLPINLILVISGRDELDRSRWIDYLGSISRLSLKPFTEDETKQYLACKGITQPKVIDAISHLSGHLPLLVATLAAEKPNDRGDLMVSPSETAINQFLKWVDEPKCRELALNAALPQVINRDIIAILHDQDNVDEMFNWLKQMPFVEERPHGWVYQDIVRTQMLQHKRLTSPQSWVDLHGRLSDYYNTQQINLGLDENRRWSNISWQSSFLHILYHNLCQFPQRNISDALNKFLNTLVDQFSSRSADTILQAGKDSGAPEVQQWGEKLVRGLAAYRNSDYQAAIKMYTDLLNQPGIEDCWKPTLLSMRGFTYSGIGQPQKAFQDLERAAELDPNHVEVLVRRGQAYYLSERYNEAIQEYNRAINLYPNSKMAVYSRGETYLAMRCYEDALNDFNSLIELKPDDSSYIAGRAACYRGMRRYEESLKDLDRVIEMNPEHIFVVSSTRSLTYRLMKRYEEALKHIERAIELAPQDARLNANAKLIANATLIARRAEIYLMLKL